MSESRRFAGFFVVLGFLAAAEAAGQRPEVPRLKGDCDGLHELSPPFKLTQNGGTEARARRDFHIAADQVCAQFCQPGTCDPATVKCRNLQPPAGAALTTDPKCAAKGGKTFQCTGLVKYCPCACETGAPTGGARPRECKGTHTLLFGHPIRGKGKTDGLARAEMKEMARSACADFCARIGHCGDDHPCTHDGEAKLDPANGKCTDGTCEADLTECKCKCSR